MVVLHMVPGFGSSLYLTLRYSNGSYFIGNFVHGMREGPGSLQVLLILMMIGFLYWYWLHQKIIQSVLGNSCWGGPCDRRNLLPGQVRVYHFWYLCTICKLYSYWLLVGLEIHIMAFKFKLVILIWPGWKGGQRRYLMGLDGARLIIDEVSRWTAHYMKIPSNVITSWTNVLRSICLQVGYYREFTPNGCDEIEWGLVGGPVWKLMVDLEGFD